MHTSPLQARPGRAPSQSAGTVHGLVLPATVGAGHEWLVKVYDADHALLGSEALGADGRFSVLLSRAPTTPRLWVKVSALGAGAAAEQSASLLALGTWCDGQAQVQVSPETDAQARQQLAAEQDSSVREPADARSAAKPVSEPEITVVKPWVAAAMPDGSPWVIAIRGQWVMLDADLALMYGVLPQRLAEKTKLNRQMFAPDEVFQLTVSEKDECVATVERLRKLRFSVALPYVYSEAAAIRVAQRLTMPWVSARVDDVARAFAQARERAGHCPTPAAGASPLVRLPPHALSHRMPKFSRATLTA